MTGESAADLILNLRLCCRSAAALPLLRIHVSPWLLSSAIRVELQWAALQIRAGKQGVAGRGRVLGGTRRAVTPHRLLLECRGSGAQRARQGGLGR